MYSFPTRILTMQHAKRMYLPLYLVALLPSLASCFMLEQRQQSLQPKSAELKVASSNKISASELGLAMRSGNDDGASDKEFVTKEMFLRDILEPTEASSMIEDVTQTGDVSVRKKKGKKRLKEYKVLDNRDILPFRVTLDTPDPYTHPELKRKNAVKTRKHSNAVEEHLIKSTLYIGNRKSGSGANDNTLLGEYQLEKDTTTGDILLIGNSEYKVVRHRCQYKYAGAQRFVMVRKILEVKEVGRLLSEAALKKQWKQDSTEHPLSEDSG